MMKIMKTILTTINKKCLTTPLTWVQLLKNMLSKLKRRSLINSIKTLYSCQEEDSLLHSPCSQFNRFQSPGIPLKSPSRSSYYNHKRCKLLNKKTMTKQKGSKL